MRPQHDGAEVGEPAEYTGNNSPWSIIGSIAKYFSIPPEYVLWEMTWITAQMYMATTPVYDWKQEGKKNEPKMNFVSKEKERETLKRALKLK